MTEGRQRRRPTTRSSGSAGSGRPLTMTVSRQIKVQSVKVAALNPSFMGALFGTAANAGPFARGRG